MDGASSEGELHRQPCRICADLLERLSSASDELSKLTQLWMDGEIRTCGNECLRDLAHLAELRAQSALIRSRFRAHCVTAHPRREFE